MTTPLLELPTELLIRIFCDLNTSDLVSCQLTHSSLCTIIDESVLLSYRKAVQLAGVEDNPHSKLPISERLRLLNAQEDAWLNFHIDFRQTIPVNHTPSGIYDLTGGVYLLGNHNCHALHYLRLPTQRSDATTWSKIDVDRNFIDVALAVYEHDLIAVLTTTPREGSASNVIELVLLKFSTGEPHPLARNPRIFILESRWPRPSINMEIAGDNLALVITCFHINLQWNPDRLYVFDWKTGSIKMNIAALDGRSFSGLVFLTPELLLVPDAVRNVLEFWNIPSSLETAPTRRMGALGLPAVSEGHFPIMLSCRAEPNPFGSGLPYSTLPFHASSMEAIVIFNLRIQGVGGPIHSFSMFVHRRTLLALCPDATVSPVSHLVDLDVIPWDRWGPSVTRWWATGAIPTNWITTTAGQRCVVNFSQDEHAPSSILILEFNPRRMKRARARNNTLYETFRPGRIVHSSFQAPVVSALPCMCYASPDNFRFDGLLMDEERLIGLHTHCGNSSPLFIRHTMPPPEYLLRLQRGIAGGFAPPTPDAVHLITKAPEKSSLNIESQVRPEGYGSLLDPASKSLHTEDGDPLVEELHGILQELPIEHPPGSEDIYGLNTSIAWHDEVLHWQNGGPEGCGGGTSMVQATEAQKEKFRRAVTIVDELVGKAK